MSGLSDVANVQIVAGVKGITRVGFGTLAIIAHNFPAAIVNRKSVEYSTDLEMAAHGWPSQSPARILANHAFAQKPRPRYVKVLNLADTSTVTVIVLTQWSGVLPPQGTVVTLTIRQALAAAPNVINVTVGAAWTIANLLTAFETAINALAISGLTAAVTTVPDELTISSTGGNFVHVDMDVSGSMFFKHLDESLASGSIGTALDSILVHDPDFYGLISAHMSSAQIAAIATWAETHGKLYFARTADSDVPLDVASNVAKDLIVADRARTTVVYHPVQSDPLACGLLAMELAKDVGTSHYVYKQVRGTAPVPNFIVETDNTNAMDADNVTYSVVVAAVSASRGGKVAAGEWVDIIRLIDFLTQRIAEDIYQVMLNNDTVPYTLGGIRSIASTVEARLTSQINKGISPDEEIVVDAPEPQDIDTTDKRARHLPGIEFSAPLEGAILTVDVRGTVTF